LEAFKLFNYSLTQLLYLHQFQPSRSLHLDPNTRHRH